MKLKNIVGLISAMSLMLVSCSEESVIDGPDVTEKADTSFDITLVSGGVETKAPGGYEYATAEEIKIQTCAVAVFAGEKMVGFEYVTFDGGKSNAKYESKDAYKVENIETKSGNVKILVVANPVLDKEALRKLNTYDKFKSQATSYDNANSFVASKLIKFGEVDKTLSTTAADDVVVPLTQIAARVDVTYKVTVENGWSAVLGKNKISGINGRSNIFLPEYKRGSYTFTSPSSPLLEKSDVTVSDNKLSFYTYETETPINIAVPVQLSYGSREEKKTYNLSLQPKFVEGKCSTDGIVHGHYYEVTGNMSIDMELNCTINWEVETFEPVPVTIPDFK